MLQNALEMQRLASLSEKRDYILKLTIMNNGQNFMNIPGADQYHQMLLNNMAALNLQGQPPS
jgi:hypothetical protein